MDQDKFDQIARDFFDAAREVFYDYMENHSQEEVISVVRGVHEALGGEDLGWLE